MPPRWYEIDTPFIPAHQFAGTLIDVCMSRDLEPNKLLRGTGIFLQDLLDETLKLRPEQCYQLIANARRLAPADTPFLIGHRLFPGNYGSAGAALTSAAHLYEALGALTAFSSQLTPLLTPYLLVDDEHALLYWQDACGSADEQSFLVATMMTAVASISRWLSDEALPWQFYIAGTPAAPEQYSVNLGQNLYTGMHFNAMAIDRDYLCRPWPRASASAAGVAWRTARAELEGHPEGGFLAWVDDYLREFIHTNPSLEQLSAALSMSPSSLKRKLKKHRTHFQQRYDIVRQRLAVDWLVRKGWSVEEVARQLHFHDNRNLRRAFKRWTGMLPSAFMRGAMAGTKSE